MPFTQFVEVGRLVLITYGPLVDKVAVVVDIIDDKRILIDVQESSESRQVISVKRIKLTDFTVKIARGAAPEAVASAVKSEGVLAKWSETKWAKKVAAGNAKLELNDFQRFKYAKIAAKRDELVKAELAKA